MQWPPTIRAAIGRNEERLYAYRLGDFDIDRREPVVAVGLETIDEGRRILKEAVSLLMDKNAPQLHRRKLVSLTNRFYTVVPHQFSASSDLLLAHIPIPLMTSCLWYQKRCNLYHSSQMKPRHYL